MARRGRRWGGPSSGAPRLLLLLVLLTATAGGPLFARAETLLDAILPGPPSVWDFSLEEIAQKLSLLKELFSSTRLIAKVKPEYQASFSEAVGRDVAPLGIQGATVEAQSSAMGIEVLKIKDGFDILNLVFELQTLKLFEFVELDFQQSLAQSSGLGMENVDEETMNEARKAWQQINMQYSTIKEVKEQEVQLTNVIATASMPQPVTPNDQSYFRQWGPHSIGMDRVWSLVNWVKNPEHDSRASGLGFSGQDAGEIIVAVLDTGIDYNHPDLKDNMWVNVREREGLEGIDDDGNGCIDDIYGCNVVGQRSGDYDVMDRSGHGTHCAGTIAAAQNNSIGISGLAPNVKLMAVKIFGDDGTGYDSDAIMGIDYAIRMGAQISSNSWAVRGDQRLGVKALEEAVRASYNAGQVFVAASGNSGNDVDVPSKREYPAGLNEANIISVMAVDEDNNMAAFNNAANQMTNYGRVTVDIAAPGVNIYSTVPDASWDFKSGTSMAVPFVAGTAAVVYSELARNGNFTGASLPDRALLTKAVILYSSRYTPALRGKCLTEGRLNAYGSLIAARQGLAGNYSDLLFPEEPESNVVLNFLRANMGPLIIAGACLLVALVLIALCCCCCFRRSRASKYSGV